MHQQAILFQRRATAVYLCGFFSPVYPNWVVRTWGAGRAAGTHNNRRRRVKQFGPPPHAPSHSADRKSQQRNRCGPSAHDPVLPARRAEI